MFKRILVPLDGSELAEAILPEVIAIATKNNSELFLLRVFEPEQALAAPISSFDTYHLVVSIQEVKKRAKQYLARIKSTYHDLPIHLITAEAIGGIGKVIAEQAAENDIDLIAMTSHGNTGFRRLMMGSVTTATLKNAVCPVLVFPTHKTEKKVKNLMEETHV